MSMSSKTSNRPEFYRPRNPEQSPFYKLVNEYFDEFERIYPERYEKTHGFWRPIIRKTIDKFLKCGDLKEGFARVKCTKCGKELFVSYSCKTRCCCPSCHQKRTLSLAYKIQESVLEEVPHRQFVFTLPKRLRIYFRYDRTLLSDLLQGAWKTVKDIFIEEVGYDDVYPAMIGDVQTYGDILNWNVHVHALVSCGIFLESGKFIAIDTIPPDRFLKKWEEVVFEFLFKKGKITPEIIKNMNSWNYSGFSVDTSVYIDKDDTKGMQRLIQYMVRCPFSLARFVRYTDEGKVLYRATKSSCLPFPLLGNEKLKAGTKRNFEIFEPCDFLAEVVQHIHKQQKT